MEGEPESEQVSTLRTYANGVNILAGLGSLSMSYALAQGGWASLILLFIVAGGMLYTGILLQRCQASSPLIRTYPDIGQHAFGRKGKVLVSVLLYLELYLILVEMLILEGDNMNKLFPHFSISVGQLRVSGKQFFTLLPALALLPVVWSRNLRLLAYVSLSGVLASFLLLITVFCVGAFGGVGFREKGAVWNWKGLPISVSLFTFCYSGHAVFPTLISSMRNRNQFPKVLMVCFGVSTLLYGSTAVVGYMMFGQGALSQITLNLPKHQLTAKVAIFTTVLTPLTKYPICIFPVCLAVEEALQTRFQINLLKSILIRTGIVSGTVALALTLPFFGDVMGFTGAFLSISISVLFPCAFYLKITSRYKNLSLELFFIGFIIIVGVAIMVSGTYSSISSIVNHM